MSKSFLRNLTDGKDTPVGPGSRAYSQTHFTSGPNAGQPKDNLNIPKNKKPTMNSDGTVVDWRKAATKKLRGSF